MYICVQNYQKERFPEIGSAQRLHDAAVAKIRLDCNIGLIRDIIVAILRNNDDNGGNQPIVPMILISESSGASFSVHISLASVLVHFQACGILCRNLALGMTAQSLRDWVIRIESK